MILKFYVKYQTLYLLSRDPVVADSSGYLQANFQFTEDWDGTNKTAQFKRTESDLITDGKPLFFNEEIDSNGNCIIPWEVLKGEGTFNVNVFGQKTESDGTTVKTITVNSLDIRVGQSGLTTDEIPQDSSPSQYDNIYEEILKAEKETQASQAAAAASQAAAKTSEANAATSATNAANSATSATNSATAAANSAKAAATSESNAKTSETHAASSASAAAGSATNAANSATAAGTQAATAKNWAEATTSPDNAADTSSTTGKTQSAKSWALYSKDRATASASSASAASTSAGNAKTSETNAANSKSAAATSASAASGSATAAANSAKAAATSEANAKTSEQNAKTFENNANASKTAAATSASSAAASATAADKSAQAAAASARTLQADWNVTDTTNQAYIKNVPASVKSINADRTFRIKSFRKSDNSGHVCYQIIGEIPNYQTQTHPFTTRSIGFTGMVIQNLRGYKNESSRDLAFIECGTGWENHYSTTSVDVIPCIIQNKTTRKYYMAIRLNGSDKTVTMIGTWLRPEIELGDEITDGTNNTGFTEDSDWKQISGAGVSWEFSAATAYKAKMLSVPRTFTLTGDANGSGTFNGASNCAIPVTVSKSSDFNATNLTVTGETTVPTANAGNSSNAIASTEFVAKTVAALVDSAPEQLNTLNELAKALGNDANFSATIMAELAKKLNSAEADSTYATKTEAGVPYQIKRNTAYKVGDVLTSPSLPPGCVIVITQAGTTGSTEPDWATIKSNMGG